jgi:hypothetical protein
MAKPFFNADSFIAPFAVCLKNGSLPAGNGAPVDQL